MKKKAPGYKDNMHSSLVHAKTGNHLSIPSRPRWQLNLKFNSLFKKSNSSEQK